MLSAELMPIASKYCLTCIACFCVLHANMVFLSSVKVCDQVLMLLLLLNLATILVNNSSRVFFVSVPTNSTSDFNSLSSL